MSEQQTLFDTPEIILDAPLSASHLNKSTSLTFLFSLTLMNNPEKQVIYLHQAIVIVIWILLCCDDCSCLAKIDSINKCPAG